MIFSRISTATAIALLMTTTTMAADGPKMTSDPGKALMITGN